MGSSSPNRVENKKYLKPPTRYYTSHSITNPNFMHYYLRKKPSKLRYTCCLFDPRNMDIILRPTKWKPPSSKGGPLPRLIERCETNGTLIFLQCWKKVFSADVSSGTQTQHQRNTLKKILLKWWSKTHHLEGKSHHLEGKTHHLEGKSHHLEGKTHHLEGKTHHLEGKSHHLEGKTHHLEGKSHHLEGKTHHLEGKSHHLEGKTHHLEGKIPSPWRKIPSPWRKIWNHRPTCSVQALNRCFFEDFLVEKPCHV